MPYKDPSSEKARESLRLRKQRYRSSDLGKDTESQYLETRRGRYKQPWTDDTRRKQQEYRDARKLTIVITRPKPKNCECCGNTGRICLDHDHLTGEFRGWLCAPCNIGLGLLGDGRQGITSMLKYLIRYESSG